MIIFRCLMLNLELMANSNRKVLKWDNATVSVKELGNFLGKIILESEKSKRLFYT